MSLFLSHSLSLLLDAMARRMVADGGSPLAERWIILPSLVQRQWMQIECAERLEKKAIAGLTILTWREAFARICRLHLNDGEIFATPLSLSLALFQIFSEPLPSLYAPVTEWLEGSPSRAVSLAVSLGRFFCEKGWEDSQAETDDWRNDLLERLKERGWRFPSDILSRASFPKSIRHLHCWGIEEMPVAAWPLMQKVPKETDLSLYLFSPCQMFWEDMSSDRERRSLLRSWQRKKAPAALQGELDAYLQEAHPLLANWGVLGREALKRLDALDLSIEQTEPEEMLSDVNQALSENRCSLLTAVQKDILFLRTANEYPPVAIDRVDDSLAILATGSSRLREVEILRERILQQIEKNRLALSDFLVLAPDIRAYEPSLRFVFGEEIPIRIAPIESRAHQPFLQALQLFLSFLSDRWEVDDVLECLENPRVQVKHRFTAEQLKVFRVWLAEAKVRGGGRKEGERGSWQHGLDQILQGLIYLMPEDRSPSSIRSIDWSQIDEAETFIRFIHGLQQKAALFQKGERSLAEWAELLEEAVFSLMQAEEGETEPFIHFLRDVRSAAVVFKGKAFPFSLLRTALDQEISGATTQFHSHQIEAIAFHSIQPGALRPARSIFVLGLDGEHFPRKPSPGPFEKSALLGDRDRYLFLQLLFCAQEHLTLSYCHLSPEDGKTVEPSPLLQDLMQTLDAFYPLKEGRTSAALTTVSAMQSFPQSKESVPSFWRFSSKGEPVLSADLADWMALARHPWKFFLKQSLGIFLKEEDSFSQMRHEDFSLSPWDERRMLQQALEQPVESVIADGERRGIFPVGSFGEWAKGQLRKKAAEARDQFVKWDLDVRNLFSLRLTKGCERLRQIEPHLYEAPPLSLGGGELTGVIEGLLPSGMIHFGDATLGSILRQWPAFLAALHVPELFQARTIYCLKSCQTRSFANLDPAEALRFWSDYAARARQSLSPLVPQWTDPFLRKGKEDWMRIAVDSHAHRFEDPVFDWVCQRALPLPLEQIWEEWNVYLREGLSGLLASFSERSKKESSDAAV